MLIRHASRNAPGLGKFLRLAVARRFAWAAFGLVVAGASPSLAEGYGAIAYSPETHAHGYTDGNSSRNGAESRALELCYQYGGTDCQVVVWEHNECAALATGAGTGWGYGFGGTKFIAQSEAVNACAARTGGCSVKRWICN